METAGYTKGAAYATGAEFANVSDLGYHWHIASYRRDLDNLSHMEVCQT